MEKRDPDLNPSVQARWMEAGRATAHLIIDESVDLVLVEKIRGRGFNVELSPREEEYEDVDVLRFAVERQAPLLTTDSDFRTPPLDIHFGILLDTDMNRRDPDQVADAIAGVLTSFEDSLENEIFRLERWYGYY